MGKIENSLRVISFFLCLRIVCGISASIDVSKNANDFSDVVCSIIRDISQNETAPQEVLLASSYKNKSNSGIGNIAKCIGSENPVVIAKLDEPIGKQDSRKASIMVVEFESIDEQHIYSIIDKQLKSTVWNHMAKLLVIIQNAITKAQRTNMQNFLFRFGFYNVAIVHKVNGEIFVDFSKTVKNDFHSTNVIENGQNFFPDKMKNLKNYSLQIPVIDETGTVEVTPDDIKSPMIYYLNILQEKMNISTQFYRIYHAGAIASFWMRKGMDLTLNTVVSIDASSIRAPKLMTYKTNGFCAIVPLPQKTKIFDVIFIKPFDMAIWICFGLTIAACLLVWWLFYNRGTQDSHWLLMFGIFAMFVGQGVEIRRTRRYVLLILLQLIVTMIFVLSNGYQGVITSFMIQPDHETRLRTIDEFIRSNHKIVAGETFQDIIKDVEEFKALKSRIVVTDLKLTLQSLNEISEKKQVIIMKCNSAELVTKRYDYYIIRQHFLTYLEQLEASYLNALIEKMQFYMDWTFQAGLQQAWDLFTWKNNKVATAEDQSPDYLKLKDLTQVFYILLIGYGLAASVFLVEIFFHDFIDNFSIKYQTSKIRKFINRIGTVKQVKNAKQPRKSERPRPQPPKVRRIDVRPINLEV